MHWAARYIGIPYEAGARGPEKLDCWGLVRIVYRNEFKIELPEHAGLALETTPRHTSYMIQQGLKHEWTHVLIPFDGALVAMGHNETIHHIGVYANADSGQVLHCLGGHSVIAETLTKLKYRGMRVLKFYRHEQWPT